MTPSNEYLNALNHMTYRARDRANQVTDRVGALKELLLHDPTRGKQISLAIASDDSEYEDMLEAVGDVLGRLLWAGLVSEFDTRDVTEVAGEIMFEWKPLPRGLEPPMDPR